MAPFEVTTVAGNNDRGHHDGLGAAARFYLPIGIASDSNGNLVVTDYGNQCIRKVNANGAVTTIAGSPRVSGHQDGVGAAARFNHPSGLAADKYDNLYVADMANHCVRKISPDGTVTTLAGSSGNAGHADGIGAAARFNRPCGLAVDDDCIVYVADTLNYRIRKVTAAGQVTTLAGSGDQSHADGLGAAAFFAMPRRIAIDRAGTMYISDKNRIRKISPEGSVTTLAGREDPGRADGLGAAASFNTLVDLTMDAAGNLYVADALNHRIRKVTPEGQVTTIAGSGTPGHADGIGTAASFNRAQGLALDASGNLLVADTLNNCIRRIEGVAPPPPPPADPASSSSFLGDMAALLDDASFADVTFAVGDERITAHRAHLAARSPYVRAHTSGRPILGLLHLACTQLVPSPVLHPPNPSSLRTPPPPPNARSSGPCSPPPSKRASTMRS